MKKHTKLFVLVLLTVALLAGYLLTASYTAEVDSARISLDMLGLEEDRHAEEICRAMGGILGPVTLIPAVITVALAFITKDVVLSLFAGVISGNMLLAGVNCVPSFWDALTYVSENTVETVVENASETFNCTVIILCLVIGGMVAVINRARGFAALARRLTNSISSPRKAGLIGELLGVLVFFDDYANSLIVGPVMRPITDRLGVSREKLAYIVDSTAAPVAGIAIISSWIAAELAAIDSGFEIVGVKASAYNVFLGSIPFCFYCVFCLMFVMFNSLTGREFGPMLTAERRARVGEALKKGSVLQGDEKFEIQNNGVAGQGGFLLTAIVPVLFLCSFALVKFYIKGYAAALAEGTLTADIPAFSAKAVSLAFGSADTVTILLEAALLASILAILMGWLQGSIGLIEGIKTWLSGASSLLMTGVILVLAWSLSSLISKLGTVYYLVELVSLNLVYWMLPTLVFITCCVISFAAGSWGCMLIVMPMVIPITFQMIEMKGIPYADSYLYACVASVLSGSIFGDHCSPVTDTTILSSVGAGCDNIDHVKTQLPYALVCAAIATLAGTLPAGLGVNPLVSIFVGTAACFGALQLFGKKV